MSYPVHSFTLHNGDKISLQYRSGFDGHGTIEHTYTLTTNSGQTYTAQPPWGSIRYDGSIAQNLKVQFFNREVLFSNRYLEIGFEHGDNIESYNVLRAELAQISKPKFEGYDELISLLAKHVEYRQYLDSKNANGGLANREEPQDYDELAKLYPEAHIYIQAQKFQKSGDVKKFKAGNVVIKRLLLGHCVKSIQVQLDSWEIASDIAI